MTNEAPDHGRKGRNLLLDMVWRLFPAASRNDVRTELEEELHRFVRPRRGPAAAYIWYARQFFGSLLWRWSGQISLRPYPLSGTSLMDSFLIDLRFAARSLLRTRAVALLALVTIALGVGASMTAFTVLNGVVLRPLPYPDPERLVRLWPHQTISKAVLEEVREGVQALEPVVGTYETMRSLTGSGEPQELFGLTVDPTYFRLFGARPKVGRLLGSEEAVVGAAPSVVLGYRLWQRTFGADEAVVGSTIQLGGQAATVVGVIDAAFRPLDESTDFWIPLVNDRANFSDYQGTAQVNLVAQLRDGVTLEQAVADVLRVSTAIQQENPDAYSEEWAQAAMPARLHSVLVADTRNALWTTMAAVSLVLLIACTNVANLLLARSTGRQREVAIRVSLGAGRWRVARQLLTESLLLGVIGGVAGVGLSLSTLRALRSSWPVILPSANAISVDSAVLGFALAVSLGASLLFGIVPALRASGIDPQRNLRSESNAVSRGSNRVSHVLVAAEMALALVLVVAAGLMLRTIQQLGTVDPGFETQQVTSLRVRLSQEGPYGDGAARVAFFEAVGDQLAALPGVRSAGAVTFLPMATGAPSTQYRVAGVDYPEDQPPPFANFQLVDGDYFATLGIPLRRGRLFDGLEAPDGPVKGLINERLAREAFLDQDPIGRTMNMFGGVDFEVVGVVGDSRQRAPSEEPSPEAFFSYRQMSWWPSMFMVVRSAGRAPTAEEFRRAIWSVDSSVPVMSVRPMSEVVSGASGRTRFFARAVGLFGALALALAGVGVYGVTSYSMSQQVREIGIRLALGATPAAVRRHVLRRAMKPMLLGALVGGLGALSVTRLMQGLLYGVEPQDPATFAAALVLLLLVGTTAAWLPARRAAAADPKKSMSGATYCP